MYADAVPPLSRRSAHAASRYSDHDGDPPARRDRADACVSIYLPTTPLSQQATAHRTVLANLLKQALTELGQAGFDKRRASMIEEEIADILDDDAFWAFQAKSLAVLATPDNVSTFRLANALKPQAEVSDRFHLKPLLRAVTFPHVALVLALSEKAVRVVEVFAEGRPEVLAVPDMPRDAASAVRQASPSDRSPSGCIQGSEGKKVRLAQYARSVDRALRPVLAAEPAPLILAAAEPLRSIFRSVSGAAALLPEAIAGNPDRLSEGELAAARGRYWTQAMRARSRRLPRYSRHARPWAERPAISPMRRGRLHAAQSRRWRWTST